MRGRDYLRDCSSVVLYGRFCLFVCVKCLFISLLAGVLQRLANLQTHEHM